MGSNHTSKEFVPGRGFSREDWDAVDSPAMTDKELAGLRPAREVMPASFFDSIRDARRARGRPSVENPKRQITLRLDSDIVDTFRASGPGWQSRMNAALRKAAGL
ncbi:BrnA antitoxin family protein [Aliihoeflea sp. 2WW]|jgi:uncharacterized protein (DUF4415 family)|uniref:BrnA antitoxin family protein n=1 Tax=Aliihoeflea sp. 2WW TaxID=1381123 RepID=UPI000464B3EB|nr:BrnA antitoxin family protein [Aliihoeflea sp. 2WW]